jgi:phosphate transport system substrate-binding protein
MTDAPRENAYPIMAASFALIRKYPKDAEHSRDVLAFFRWALENGQNMASSLDYLPLSPTIVHEVEGYWDAQWGLAAKAPMLRRVGLDSPG